MAHIEKEALGNGIFQLINFDKINENELIETDLYFLFKKGEIKIIISKEGNVNFFSEYSKKNKTCFIISEWDTNNIENFKYILGCCLDNRITPETISKLLFLSFGDILKESYSRWYILYSVERIDARSKGVQARYDREKKEKVIIDESIITYDEVMALDIKKEEVTNGIDLNSFLWANA